MGFKEDKDKNNKQKSRKDIINDKINTPNKNTRRVIIGFLIAMVVFYGIMSFSNNPNNYWEDPNIEMGDIRDADESEGVVDDNDDLDAPDDHLDNNEDPEDPKTLKEDLEDQDEEDQDEEDYEYGEIKDSKEKETPESLEEMVNNKKKTPDVEGVLKIHYIDVGQGDSILIEEPNGDFVLIDGGPRSSSKKLISYLQNNKVVDLKAVIATHPHEDHIGGLVDVLNTIPVQNIYMPNVTHTTKVFENLLKAIDKNGVSLLLAEDFRDIGLSQGYSHSILYPITNTDKVFRDKSNLNLYSIVSYLEFGSTSFMFTGDAEIPVENYLSSKYGDEISTTVLKAGHHGSNTSSSEYFLDTISPKIAVITSGKNNKYGHPHKEVMERFKDRNIKVYDTKKDGTIIIESNGSKLNIKTEASGEI